MGGGSVAEYEIPLLSSFLYLLGWTEPVRRSPKAAALLRSRAKRAEWSEAVAGGAVFRPFLNSAADLRLMLPRDPIRGHCQAGSLAGAVHLSKNNAGVLRPAQRGQKPRVEQKGKSWLDPDVQYA